jgi:ubiquinone biosynthesis protein COQ4
LRARLVVRGTIGIVLLVDNFVDSVIYKIVDMPQRNRPLVALRALADLANDPDDLPKVFKIIESLPGRSTERILARMKRSETGRRLVQARPDLSARLNNRNTLAALPEGTLGRAYFELTEQAKISAAGIVMASMAERSAPLIDAPELRFAGERMRDTHDLWHVVTGYGTDVLGEIALLSFTLAQAWHSGIGLMVGFAYLQRAPSVNEQIRDAYGRGKRAAWLPAVAWEELLDQPVDAVRSQLQLGAPPRYVPITSAQLRAGEPGLRRFFSRRFFGGVA